MCQVRRALTILVIRENSFVDGIDDVIHSFLWYSRQDRQFDGLLRTRRSKCTGIIRPIVRWMSFW